MKRGNEAVWGIVDRATYWALRGAMWDAVDRAMADAASDAVYRAVPRAMGGAVYEAVNDSSHPALQDFLREAR